MNQSQVDSNRATTGLRRRLGVSIAALAMMLGFAGCATTSTSSLASPGSSGATIYVSADGTCTGLTPCFGDLQSAVNAANPGGGDTVAVFDGTYNLAAPSNPGTPVIQINKPVTITAQDAQDPTDACPTTASACPQFVVAGDTYTPVEITSGGVEIDNLAFSQVAVPSSDPLSAIIYVPANGSALHSTVRLNEVAVIGGRRGAWISGDNVSVTYSVFANQAADSMLLPAVTGTTTIQGNAFSGNAGKAALFEAQYGSPPTSGQINLVSNTLYGKSNFAVWNTWPTNAPAASVSLVVDNNTIVGTTGAAVALLPGPAAAPGFAMFKGIAVTDTIVTTAGGDAAYVDYTYSPTPAAVPANGAITVGNMLTYQNKSSPGTNDPTGGFGFSPSAPAGSSLAMFNIATKTNISGKNPLLTDPAQGDFSLGAKSPAIGAASGQNIGAWQGTRPVVRGVIPGCKGPGDTVNVIGQNFSAAAIVTFGGASAKVGSLKHGNARDVLSVTVPPGPAGTAVDVTVKTTSGAGTLLQGFEYANTKGGCSAS